MGGDVVFGSAETPYPGKEAYEEFYEAGLGVQYIAAACGVSGSNLSEPPRIRLNGLHCRRRRRLVLSTLTVTSIMDIDPAPEQEVDKPAKQELALTTQHERPAWQSGASYGPPGTPLPHPRQEPRR